MKECKVLTELMKNSRITRRQFVQQAASPKKGGTFRQALTGGGSGDVLDPAQTLDSYMINVSFGQLRNNLTEITPDGNLVGELAESWEASDDATSWRFKIRKGTAIRSR